jgi:UDP-glucuronate 4-epimerase
VNAPQRDRSTERCLVTGAYGCIGAWTIRHLVDEGVYVVALDLSDDPRRLRLLMGEEELSIVHRAHIDITDLGALERAFDEHEITNVIHLAALQVPFCRANPPLGARVNVVGTINVLEVVARRRARMAPLVYASSIATYEAIDKDADRQPRADGGIPGTLYGVYKRANEGAAAVYWRDHGVASVGLRPHTVYGPGRDQGLTSAPTSAMLAAAVGVPFRIPYGGRLQVQYAPDVARAFVDASRTVPSGASVHNLAGHRVHMSDIVRSIELAAPDAAGTITYDDNVLPFPDEVDANSLGELIGPASDTPLEAGVADTVARFKRLIAAGFVSVDGPDRRGATRPSVAEDPGPAVRANGPD